MTKRKDRLLSYFLRNKLASKEMGPSGNRAERRSFWPSVKWVAMSAFLGAIFLLIGQLEKALGDLESIRDRVTSWWFSDVEWVGSYTNDTEYLNDALDWALFEGALFEVRIESDGSFTGLTGEIYSNDLCGLGFEFPQVFMVGDFSLIDPNVANFELFDLVGGRKVAWADIKINLNNDSIEIVGFPSSHVPVRLLRSEVALASDENLRLCVDISPP